MNIIKRIKNFWKRHIVGLSVVTAEYRNHTMAIEWDDGTKTEYHGSCTVWYELPLMKRCDTSTEGLLCEMWEYNKKWGGPYPKAHRMSQIELVVGGIIDELDCMK